MCGARLKLFIAVIIFQCIAYTQQATQIQNSSPNINVEDKSFKNGEGRLFDVILKPLRRVWRVYVMRTLLPSVMGVKLMVLMPTLAIVMTLLEGAMAIASFFYVLFTTAVAGRNHGDANDLDFPWQLLEQLLNSSNLDNKTMTGKPPVVVENETTGMLEIQPEVEIPESMVMPSQILLPEVMASGMNTDINSIPNFIKMNPLMSVSLINDILKPINEMKTDPQKAKTPEIFLIPDKSNAITKPNLEHSNSTKLVQSDSVKNISENIIPVDSYIMEINPFEINSMTKVANAKRDAQIKNSDILKPSSKIENYKFKDTKKENTSSMISSTNNSTSPILAVESTEISLPTDSQIDSPINNNIDDLVPAIINKNKTTRQTDEIFNIYQHEWYSNPFVKSYPAYSKNKSDVRKKNRI